MFNWSLKSTRREFVCKKYVQHAANQVYVLVEEVNFVTNGCFYLIDVWLVRLNPGNLLGAIVGADKYLFSTQKCIQLVKYTNKNCNSQMELLEIRSFFW